MKTMQQGWLSNWLVKHEVVHRSLGFHHRGIETLQIKAEDWDSIAVILYVYGYNYLRSQCAYNVAPGGSLASVLENRHVVCAGDSSSALLPPA
uniref:NADH:ubiquinone oxidoreductase 30kDa subunit domain-containing protein n=1 Tax=Aegilops tauschii subsp. strangulata TaxID=200361 RepID=A0A453HBQ8_AEGTS